MTFVGYLYVFKNNLLHITFWHHLLPTQTPAHIHPYTLRHKHPYTSSHTVAPIHVHPHTSTHKPDPYTRRNTPDPYTRNHTPAATFTRRSHHPSAHHSTRDGPLGSALLSQQSNSPAAQSVMCAGVSVFVLVGGTLLPVAVRFWLIISFKNRNIELIYK